MFGLELLRSPDVAMQTRGNVPEDYDSQRSNTRVFLYSKSRGMERGWRIHSQRKLLVDWRLTARAEGIKRRAGCSTISSV